VAPCLSQELWVVPPGSAPKPREDAYDNRLKATPYKFDEHYYQSGKSDPDEISYWRAPPENLIGYLETFGETLLKNPKLVAYLVAFRDAAKDHPNVTKRILQTERNFLIKEFRINPSRIKIIDGGPGERRTVELWIAEARDRPVITSYRVVHFRE